MVLLLNSGDERWVQLARNQPGQKGSFVKRNRFGYVFKIGTNLYEVTEDDISNTQQSVIKDRKKGSKSPKY